MSIYLLVLVRIRAIYIYTKKKYTITEFKNGYFEMLENIVVGYEIDRIINKKKKKSS